MKIFIFLFLISYSNYAQPKSNFDIIEMLFDQSVDSLVTNLDLNLEYNAEMNMPNGVQILKPHFYLKLKNVDVKLSNSQNINEINYSLLKINVNYPEEFGGGIFGKSKLIRKVSIEGEYYISKLNAAPISNEFFEQYTDTIFVDEVEIAERSGFDFARGSFKDLSSFTSIWEPVIAISAIAVSILLFFTVRSN